MNYPNNRNKREILLNSRENLIKQNGVLDEIDKKLNNEFTNDLDKIKFIDRLQNKINKLTDIGVLVQFKYSDLKFWYDFFNIFIIIISALLTVIEAIKNEIDYENSSNFIKYLFKIVPILIATIITLLGTILKFKKYQDDLELMAKTLEKSIITIYRMKKLQENLHFADQTKIEVIQSMYIDEIFLLYNQSNAEMRQCIGFKEQMHYKSKTEKYIPKSNCSSMDDKAVDISNNTYKVSNTLSKKPNTHIDSMEPQTLNYFPLPKTPTPPMDSMMTQTQNYIPLSRETPPMDSMSQTQNYIPLSNYNSDSPNINNPFTSQLPSYVARSLESPTLYNRSNIQKSSNIQNIEYRDNISIRTNDGDLNSISSKNIDNLNKENKENIKMIVDNKDSDNNDSNFKDIINV